LSTSTHEKTVNFADDETNSTHSGSVHIDIDYLNKSLEHVNNFSKRRQTDKLPPVLMYEINCFGKSSYKSITLRELLNDVNAEAAAIDENALRRFASCLPNAEDTGDQALHNSEPLATNHTHSSAYTRGSIRSSPNLSSSDLQSLGATAYPPLPANIAHDPSWLSAPKAGTLRMDNVNLPPTEASSRRRTVSNAVHPAGLAGTRSLYDMRYSPAEHTDPRFSPPHPIPTQPAVHGVHDIAASNTAAAAPILATGALRLRDLRRLDFQFNPNEERSVLIRRHAVLFAMVSTAQRPPVMLCINGHSNDPLLCLLCLV
jgi:hypothetical protein